MYFYLIPLIFQILTILLVLVWMGGTLIIVKEFLREYREKKHETAGRETEKFMQWKSKRNIRMKKGFRIMIAGFALQVVIIVIQYLCRLFLGR